MIRISPLAAITILVSILILASPASSSDGAGWNVQSQGILTRETPPSTILSPNGSYTLRIVPSVGDGHHFECDLFLSASGRVATPIGTIRANGFFLDDEGRVVALDRSDANGLKTPLTVLARDGRILLETKVDLLCDAILCGDSFAWRTTAGLARLDLDDLSITTYPPLGRFTVGPNGSLCGTSLASPMTLRLFTDSMAERSLPLPIVPTRLAFSRDGGAVLTLDRQELFRIDPTSGESHRLLTADDRSRLRDLRVTSESVIVGLRRTVGDSNQGEMLVLDDDGTILERVLGAARPIERVATIPEDRQTIPWPLQPNGQHRVGNTYGEFQDYGSSYLHPGVDVMGNPGQPVYAVEGGVVKAILTTSGEWHWRIAIGQPGSGTSTGYLYAHVDQPTIAVDIGDPIVAGQYLGDLVEWPIYGFTHCHFARIEDTGTQWYGSWLNTDNPHLDFENQSETEAPVFEPARLNDLFAFCVNQTNLYRNPDSLEGEIDIIAHVGDRIFDTWVCSVQELRYSIYPLGNPGYPIVDDKLAVNFDMVLDTYQGGPIDPMLVDLLYKNDSTCNTQGDYVSREFYHIITNSNGDDVYDGSDFYESWDTSALPDGQYVIEVTATDVVGNATTESMIVTTANGNPSAVDPPDGSTAWMDRSYPNPARHGAEISFGMLRAGHAELSIFDATGRRVRILVAKRSAGQQSLFWDGRDGQGVEAAPGIYPYRLQAGARVTRGKVTLIR